MAIFTMHPLPARTIAADRPFGCTVTVSEWGLLRSETSFESSQSGHSPTTEPGACG
ncbi:hypothetical protein BN2476_240002 [Paraburkholderia piptadeniae]|uniref:Uncharacterized protein n=1 Tax=Paraburkholderia piptadeniae TaxID=1701573 RepID=A0A1N7RYD2_9BURK|nr:hypothetical protein BN2476_240002 [Paraburkholderia piptadeniae]